MDDNSKSGFHVFMKNIDFTSWFQYGFAFTFRAKYAIGAIKKKLNDKNPHVALYGLEVCAVINTKIYPRKSYYMNIIGVNGP